MNYNHVSIHTNTNDKKAIKKKVAPANSNILGRQDSVATIYTVDKHCKPHTAHLAPKTYRNVGKIKSTSIGPGPEDGLHTARRSKSKKTKKGKSKYTVKKI